METVPEIREVLVALARRYAFRELAYLVGGGVAGLALNNRELAQVQQLCAYGQRLCELDTEDLGNADASTGANTDTTFAALVVDEHVPEHLVARGRLCHIRQQPAEHVSDALGSLQPAFRLLLEVIDVRWQRRETLAVLAAAHIASEYAPLLAWEPLLGHAGDPARIRVTEAFTGSQSRWGKYDDPACPHTRPEKAAAGRALRVSAEPRSSWRRYLDRQHSVVAHALAVCAAQCREPCTVLTTYADSDRQGLSERCRIALSYAGSALVKLRHRAPVGHGFGVPSPAEVLEAWQRGRKGIAKRGGLAMQVMTEDGFALPGLPSLFGVIAGRPITPDTLVADTRDEILRALDPDGLVSPEARLLATGQ